MVYEFIKIWDWNLDIGVLNQHYAIINEYENDENFSIYLFKM